MNRERAARWANWGAAVAALSGLGWVLLGAIAFLATVVPQQALQQNLPQPLPLPDVLLLLRAFGYFAFLFTYFYWTLAFAIYRHRSRAAALAFLAIELWFTYNVLRSQKSSWVVVSVIVLGVVWLVAAALGVTGTFALRRERTS